MYVKVCMLLVILSQLSVTLSAHVSGTITDDVKFFYRKFQGAPFIRASIEFNVSHQLGSRDYYYPLMGIYTEYPSVNIEKRCSYMRFGQLHNENLHPFLRVGRYRTTTCKSSGYDTVNCTGRVTVQDYIPRNFYLTFGFHCIKTSSTDSLHGLEYTISFTQQSNSTIGCINYAKQFGSTTCKRLYYETSMPNLIGDEQLDQINNYFKVIEVFQMASSLDGSCYQHTEEIVCYVVFPKCDPHTQQVIHPCREMCSTLKKACLQKWLSMLIKTNSNLKGWFSDVPKAVNCDYLPSLHDSVPCFYKPVICVPPTHVTKDMRILNDTQKEVYQLHDVIQYACVNESLQITGSDSIKCLYSGEWSNSPPKCESVEQVENSGMNPLYIVLPILLLPLFVLLLGIVGVKCKRRSSPKSKAERIDMDDILAQLTYNDEPLLPLKRKQESTLSLESLLSLKRNREFDAFVLYCFDSDHDFVVNCLIPELEEARHLRLNIHSRDFPAGYKIEKNIENAIKSSNNAIILMSFGFTTSRWCADEFTHCYIEHVEDPSFKLFIIMMEPHGDLTDLAPNMKKILTEETYLHLQDPELFYKLYKYLKPDDNSDVTNSN